MITTMLLFLLAGGMRASVVSLVLTSSPFAKFILIMLTLVSVYSWAIIWNRLRLYGRLERADKAFADSFKRFAATGNIRLLCDQHPTSPLARMAREGHAVLERPGGGDDARRRDLAQRVMERRGSDESATLEKHIGFLATTGSVAPFVGLMGTVWGVMSAFLSIGSQGSASLVVVAPGIAEALIATVAGLAAAIPSVVGYNHCLGRLREFGNRASQFTGEFVDRVGTGAPS
jgi:biopolymer transport protein TolQ